MHQQFTVRQFEHRILKSSNSGEKLHVVLYKATEVFMQVPQKDIRGMSNNNNNNNNNIQEYPCLHVISTYIHTTYMHVFPTP